MNGYLLAGALLGLTLLGIGAPMVMAMAQYNGPTPWYMYGAENGHRNESYANDHALRNKFRECSGTHEQIRSRIRDQNRVQDRVREYSDRTNLTIITGTIVEINPEEGVLTLNTDNGNITVIYRGRWTDGSSIIPYYNLLKSNDTGEMTITGFYRCSDEAFRAVQITINDTTYELAMQYHH